MVIRLSVLFKCILRIPLETFRKLSPAYINDGAFKVDMCNIRLLRQEILAKELVQFLQTVGFDREELEFIFRMEKVNVSRRTYDSSELSDAVIAHISYYESMLFNFLASFDIYYEQTCVS